MTHLLTASEANAFQSFLSQMNYDSSLVDSLVASSEWSSLTDDIPVPYASDPDKKALAKATKDLMSLQPRSPVLAFSPRQEYRDIPFFKQHSLTRQLPPLQPPTDHLLSSVQRWQDAIRGRQSSLAISPPLRTPSSSSHSLPSNYPDASPSPTSSAPTGKRAFSNDSNESTGRSSAKRLRSSSSQSTPKPSTSATPSQPSPAGKPVLLTASQKKANHIQSEQKRRANIRRGYEALCDTVPALREAIRAEEEANGAGAGAAATGGGASGAKKRRTRGKVSEDGEKIDGRAGPRSENIVLGKTVDHIQLQLAEKRALLERLHRARAMLPPGHPGAMPLCDGTPLWDREWTGGKGANDDEAADASDDEDS